MSKLRMLAGGIVEAGAGSPGAVSAYVAYNASPGESRLFKVQGSLDGPSVSELAAATTVDLGFFRRELENDLQPTLEQIRGAGGPASIASPKAEWVAQHVRRHLKDAEDIDVD